MSKKLSIRLMGGVSALTFAAALNAPAFGQNAIDEIVVTARKKAESLQDVPVAVNALGEKALDELGVDVFTDYLVQMPGVTAGGSGPGQNTIYIRGVASTTPNLTTAGVAGLAPNVALYLDEQPLAQPGRNLDVYAVDMQRIEVLSGPQGTLFGASSQAGVVRLITNKPNLDEFEARTKLDTSFTPEGEMSAKLEAVVNVPLNDRAALRAVFYTDNQGGYIDNVHGTLSTRESARFRAANTRRSNGTLVEAHRGGFQSGADLSGVTFIEADNAEIVEKDFNDTNYSGMRLSGVYEVNSDTKINVAHTQQRLDSEGVFFVDPTLGDLEIQRYQPDDISDSFHNTNWTVETRLGALEMLYTGAFTARETDQIVDYADYLYVGQYIPYYICDYNVSYGATPPAGTCQSPDLAVISRSKTDVQTHELRFNTPQEQRLRATFGGFFSDLELRELNNFTYYGSQSVTNWNSTLGFAPNRAFPGGYTSDTGAFPGGVIFRNDVLRTDKQLGAFGEATFDVVPDEWAVTLGARWYDIEVDLAGTANSSFCNMSGAAGSDANAFGTDINDLYDGDGSYTFRGDCTTAAHLTFNRSHSVADIQSALETADPDMSGTAGKAQQIYNAVRAPDTAKSEGEIFKFNLAWTPVDDVMLYATWSEGFRPGLLNRPGGAVQAANNYTVPFVLESDEVENIEFGWKTTLMDGRLRLNGNVFKIDITNLQTTIFDTSIVNLFFSDNAADAEVTGLESDFVYLPEFSNNLTIAGAISVLDSEITTVHVPTGDVQAGQELAFAPPLQFNLRARYEWQTASGRTAHIMPQLVYSDSSFSDVIRMNRDEVQDSIVLNVSAGVRAEDWALEFYADNLTDERAEISRNYVNDVQRATVIRPLTLGVRLTQNY